MTAQEKFAIASERPYIPRESGSDFKAFSLLAAKFPNFSQMVAAAAHDEIHLLENVGEEELDTLTQDEVDALNDLGVWYNDEYSCLSMCR